MNQIMLFASNIIIAFLDFGVIIYCMYYFMMKQERNIYRKKWCYVLGAVLIFILTMAVTYSRSNIAACIGFLLLTAGAGYFLFNNTRLHLFYHLLFAVLFSGIQILAISLVNFAIVQIQLPMEQYGIIYSDVLMLVKQMAELVFTKIAAEFFRRRRFQSVPFRRLLSYLVLPVLSVCFLLSLVSFAVYIQMAETLLIVAVNMILLVGMNLYVTYLFEKMEKNKELEQELSLNEQQAKMQYQYYRELEEKYQGSRKIIHDIRNHLVTLETLYRREHDESNEPGRAAGYMADLHDMLNELGQKYYSSNQVLNIVLNDKERVSHALGIGTEFSVKEVNLEFLRDIDLTTIFANLLDNAIEAAGISEKKEILLHIDRFHELAVIRLENTADQAPKKRHGRYVSGKDGKSGIGLLNVDRVVKTCHGSMSTKYESGRFYVFITFPLEQEA